MARFTPTRLVLLLSYLVLVGLIARPVITGGIILWRAHQMEREVYRPIVRLEDPYSAEELERAKANLAPFATTQDIAQGFPQATLESAMLAGRKMERARQQAWQQKHALEVGQARQRRPLGMALLGLGVVLLAVWTWTVGILWKKYDA